MGSDHQTHPTNLQNDSSRISYEIQAQYYRQVFIQNKLSTLQFNQKLASIRKRAAYLKYEWVRELEACAKVTNKQKLYSEYKSTLKENCLRQGRKQKLFCPTNFRKTFEKEMSQKIQRCLKNTTFQEVNNIIEECKAFLMVTRWLNQLVTLQKDVENQSQAKKISLGCQNKDMFDRLLNLVEKYYKQLFKFDKVQPIVIIGDRNIREHIATLKKKRGFHQRELTIINLIKLVEADRENSIQNFMGICCELGKANVAAHLLLVREFGTYQEVVTTKYINFCLDERLSFKRDCGKYGLN